jgi:hypothetical protein
MSGSQRQYIPAFYGETPSDATISSNASYGSRVTYPSQIQTSTYDGEAEDMSTIEHLTAQLAQKGIFPWTAASALGPVRPVGNRSSNQKLIRTLETMCSNPESFEAATHPESFEAATHHTISTLSTQEDALVETTSHAETLRTAIDTNRPIMKDADHSSGLTIDERVLLHRNRALPLRDGDLRLERGSIDLVIPSLTRLAELQQSSEKERKNDFGARQKFGRNHLQETLERVERSDPAACGCMIQWKTDDYLYDITDRLVVCEVSQIYWMNRETVVLTNGKQNQIDFVVFGLLWWAYWGKDLFKERPRLVDTLPKCSGPPYQSPYVL